MLWWFRCGVIIAVLCQMGSDKCVVVQMESENCCGGSDRD
jgi:hypothetical protein